jgi:hypothetical protein
VPGGEPALCARCVLPATFPGADFDEAGVCAQCRAAPPPERAALLREDLAQKLSAVFDAARGRGAYDVIVAFSGGKDSSYTLMELVERQHLRCLAVTIDNGFVAEQAFSNIRAVTGALGVDFLMFRPAPAFMNKVYRTSATGDVHPKVALTRASSLCNSCIGLINAQMVRIALEKGVGVIAGGYIGGQVPRDAAVLEIDLDVHARFRAESVKRYLLHFGAEAAGYYGLPEELVAASGVKKLHVVNPMLALGVSEGRIVEELARLGWKKTADTGKNSTNCLLNELGVRIHVERQGHHPYAMEVAEQVRSGLMTRAEGIEKLSGVPSREEVAWQAERIGLDFGDLR